jgi:excinuclease UvrABC nuclease subunit
VEGLADWQNNVSFTLNRTGVLRHAPESSGVYGLRHADQWVYIGQSPNIRKALLKYLAGQMPYVLQAQPNLFVFELCTPRQRAGRQRELTQRYHPTCNKKHMKIAASGCHS